MYIRTVAILKTACSDAAKLLGLVYLSSSCIVNILLFILLAYCDYAALYPLTM